MNSCVYEILYFVTFVFEIISYYLLRFLNFQHLFSMWISLIEPILQQTISTLKQAFHFVCGESFLATLGYVLMILSAFVSIISLTFASI